MVVSAAQSRTQGLRRKVQPIKRVFAKAMRQNPTPAEAYLWQRIRRGGAGAKFRRQAIIRGFIADFYCPSADLIVEVDGRGHDAEKDRRRDAALRRLGFRVLRFSNEFVFQHLDQCVEQIRDAARGSRGED